MKVRFEFPLGLIEQTLDIRSQTTYRFRLPFTSGNNVFSCVHPFEVLHISLPRSVSTLYSTNNNFDISTASRTMNISSKICAFYQSIVRSLKDEPLSFLGWTVLTSSLLSLAILIHSAVHGCNETFVSYTTLILIPFHGYIVMVLTFVDLPGNGTPYSKLRGECHMLEHYLRECEDEIDDLIADGEQYAREKEKDEWSIEQLQRQAERLAALSQSLMIGRVLGAPEANAAEPASVRDGEGSLALNGALMENVDDDSEYDMGASVWPANE